MQATQLESQVGAVARKTRPISLKDLQKRLAARVRQDSNRGQPTDTLSLKLMFPDTPADDIDKAIDGFSAVGKYSDIRRVMAVTRGDYLFSNLHITQEQAGRLAFLKEFKADLVDSVRDSSRSGKLVRLSSVAKFGPSLTTAEIETGLGAISRDPDCRDLKQAATFSGAVFLYSEEYLDETSVLEIARHDELARKVSTRIREDSQYSSKLTRFESLETLAPDVRPGEIEGILQAIKQDSSDIRSLPGRDGEEYLFCIRYMTENYARMLARVGANDPCYTILETVREESRVYPRPTNVELFKYGMFSIDREKLDEYVEKVLKDNDDINGYRSSTGNVYLYSTSYLPDAQAALIVEKKEHPE